MRLFSISIAVYLVGLLVFYTSAVFDTLVWDIVYFSWSKIADCGLLMWSFLFFYLRGEMKRIVRPLFLFSILRFICDIQSWFSGIGVNNNIIVALLFLGLSVLAGYLILHKGSSANKFLDKYL